MLKSSDNRSLILSVIMAAVIPFPFIIAGFVSIFERADYLCFCFGTALGILSWLLGQLFGYLLKKSSNKGMLHLVRIWFWIFCGALIFLAEAYLFHFEEQSLSVMFTPAAAILWCWFGFRFGSGQTLMPVAIVGIYCVEAAFMYPITDTLETKSSIGRTAILAITAVVILCGVLFFNRRQLNNLSNMGKNRGRPVTKATLRFNTRTTLIFGGIILFMFFFAGFGARWLWEGIKAIIRFIIYLLMGNPLEGGEDDSYTDEVIIPEELTRLNTAPFWTAVVILAIILVVILMRKHIMQFIREFIEDFKRRFGKAAAANETAHYTDTYLNTKTRPYRRDTFKRAVKAFKKEKELTKKYRLGYKAFMTAIDEKGEGRSRSDTVKVHLEKGRRLTDFGELDKVVLRYCDIRYGGEEAMTEDCRLMAGFLDYLKKA